MLEDKSGCVYTHTRCTVVSGTLVLRDYCIGTHLTIEKYKERTVLNRRDYYVSRMHGIKMF